MINYILVIRNHIVRKVENNNLVYTVAGTGSAGYFRDQWLGYRTI